MLSVLLWKYNQKIITFHCQQFFRIFEINNVPWICKKELIFSYKLPDLKKGIHELNGKHSVSGEKNGYINYVQTIQEITTYNQVIRSMPIFPFTIQMKRED